MAVRSSMADLIALLRVKVNDVDEEIWTDEDLQKYLDMKRVHIRREQLRYNIIQKTFYSEYGMFEDDVSLWDSNSDSATEVTGYTANLLDGTFTFTSEQDVPVYLDAISYDLHAAIAECLEQLTTDPSRAKSWSRGGVSYTHYDLMELVKHHRSQSGPQSILINKTYRKDA